MRITVELLGSLGACKDQLERFAMLFPDGAEATIDNVLWALRHRLDLNWFALKLLPKRRRREWSLVKERSDMARATALVQAVELCEWIPA